MNRFNRNHEGVRWQRWDDPAMRGVAEERACEDMPWADLDEVWRRHGGHVEIAFGSTAATATFGAVCGQVRSLFLHGYCSLFAFAAAQKMGATEFVLVTSAKATDARWSGHVGVLLDDGQVLDVTGANPFDTFGDNVLAEVRSREVVDLEHLRARIFDGEFRDNPLDFVEPLEQFMLHSWVDAVLADANVPVAV